MITMISSATIDKAKNPPVPRPDSDDPETDDFAALLNGLSYVAPPVLRPVQASPAEEGGKGGDNSQSSNAVSEEPTQPLPQFPDSVVLPKNFSEVFKAETPKSEHFSSEETAKDTDPNSFDLIDLTEIDKADAVNGDAEIDESLFAQIENIEVEGEGSKTEQSQYKSFEQQSQAEGFSTGGKNESPNKLPKLFREVSSFFDISDSAIGTQNIPEHVRQTAESQNITAQIEPQMLHLVQLAAKTGIPQLLKMRLNPAELGAVEIRIEKDSSGKLKAHFQTENEEARRALTENISELQNSLQNSGWNIEHIEVSCGSNATAGNEPRENSSRGFENTDGKTLAQAQSSGGSLNDRDELNSEKSNRLLSVRA